MLDAQAAQPLGKTILNNLEELNGQIVKIHIYVAWLRLAISMV
jgi:hypothetical protein